MDVVARTLNASSKLQGRPREDGSYFTGSHEKRLERPDWATRPKPKVNAEPPVDIENSDAIIDEKLMLDVMFLALQTDSTRFITLHLVGEGGAVSIDGDEGYQTCQGLDETNFASSPLVESDSFTAGEISLRQLEGSRRGQQHYARYH